ncbi:MAG: 1-acyl-sn-glycerol-3-phosphate acyltransferase [Proteobacteria bacterium]|nr:1-acyl-sn-glycerol-3-phosphate acyltransferase [Pseudomonadota bacterium]
MPPLRRATSLLLLPFTAVYALWVAAAFLATGLAALLMLIAVPGLARRRALARLLARGFLTVAGMPVRLESPEHLPGGQCVVVCNHASYLDGIVLTAALPARFGFVIKREMSTMPLAGAALKRLGSQFVERFDRQRGSVDARRVLRHASNGESMVFFPEGTFTPSPGLLRFHSGAFVTAARASCPVVPAVVRGTRRALPPRGGLPRPGVIELEILAPITAASLGSDAGPHALCAAARGAILERLGEPDLTAEPTPSELAA